MKNVPLTPAARALLAQHGIKPRRPDVSPGQFKQLADKLGATIDDEKSGDGHYVRFDAPAGHRLAGYDLHGSGFETYYPDKQCYNSYVNEMAQGFEPCEDPDCEVCRPSE